MICPSNIHSFKFTLFLLLQENQAFQLYVTAAYPDHSHLLFVVFILYIQLNSECIITQKFIVNELLIAINGLIMDFCGDVVCLVFPLCTDHEIY